MLVTEFNILNSKTRKGWQSKSSIFRFDIYWIVCVFEDVRISYTVADAAVFGSPDTFPKGLVEQSQWKHMIEWTHKVGS